MTMRLIICFDAVHINTIQRVMLILYSRFEGDLAKLPRTGSDLCKKVKKNWRMFDRLSDEEKIDIMEALKEDVADLPTEILDNSFDMLNDSTLMALVVGETGDSGTRMANIVESQYNFAISELKVALQELEPAP